jgi:hypothetical protein
MNHLPRRTLSQRQFSEREPVIIGRLRNGEDRGNETYVSTGTIYLRHDYAAVIGQAAFRQACASFELSSELERLLDVPQIGLITADTQYPYTSHEGSTHNAFHDAVRQCVHSGCTNEALDVAARTTQALQSWNQHGFKAPAKD